MSGTIFRRAVAADVPAIVALLADDVLGAAREQPGDPAYDAAFAAIETDPNQLLAVAEQDGAVVGCLQLTFLPGLSHRGVWRGQIESVRVAAGRRGSGLGRRFLGWAVEQCRARGCAMVQLTTSNSRTEARRFYESLGFVASHQGMKLGL
ncbi:GNAT family N-acetyltransferase [Roseomonas sp. HJA6]|uniref:GNAT family N-acetyltransferase n=1 Tax=Roseomonas alba TaxID=2846776 RepID=A0ABS7AA98_9PROT|nr:GNAT family N-acetyltransferase [Neoroseomonas alba]MBW6399015.1 GNAT family N-acetyltransferase [Neoroseomonas alba]